MIGRDRLIAAAGAATVLLAAVLLVNALAIIRAMESVPDYVSPLVMGHDAGLYPDARIVLGNYGWWPGLWAVQLLQPLPLAENLADALPLAITVLVTVLVALQAGRLAGREGVLVVLAIALACGVSVWLAAASWSAHFTTWWCTALAGLTAVAWIGGRRRWALAGAVVTLVWGAVVVSGDRLAYAGVVAPLVAAAVAAGAVRAWRPAAVCAGLAGAMVAGGALVAELANDAGYFEHSFTITTVGYEQLGGQAANAFVALQQLWAGQPTVLGATVGYLGAGVALGALLSVPALLTRRADPARTVWVAFWAAAVLAPIGAFMLSNQSIVDGAGQARYLYGVPLAVAALVAVAPRRRLALGAAALLALGTSVNFITDPPQRQAPEHLPALTNILAAAREHDVTRGYASYVTAYPLQRASRFELRLSPVGDCPTGLCPMYLHRLDGAFAGAPGRTFVLVDRSPIAAPGNPNWATVEPAGVRPAERIDVGDGLEMLIYDRDVASAFGPLPPL